MHCSAILLSQRSDKAANMKLNLTVDGVLTTTRSVRKRLDLSRPVPRSIIEEALEIAMQAPNGSNRNLWRWLVIDDRKTIEAIGRLYADATAEFAEHYQDASAGLGIERQDQLTSSAMTLIESLPQMPALLVPLMPGRAEGKYVPEQASMWGSIVQAVWSFFLALRERGLGSAWTTLTLHREREMAELLGIPFADYTQVGMFPIAYTVGTDFKRAWRRPLAEVLSYNRF
jgi:nitroreductase